MSKSITGRVYCKKFELSTLCHLHAVLNEKIEDLLGLNPVWYLLVGNTVDGSEIRRSPPFRCIKPCK